MKTIDSMLITFWRPPAAAILLVFGLFVPSSTHAADVPKPDDVFGFRPGDDYKLADYEQLIDYYRKVDAASDRVRMREIGKSATGRPMYLLIVSGEENMGRLEELRIANEKLARARVGEDEARRLAREGRAVVWVDGGLDDQELATGQMMPELVYRAVTEETEEMQKVRQNVVVLFMPHMNPDAARNDTDWYRGHRGTPFEITEPPRLGQKYVGTDNNRDWFMITQPETWAASKIFYHEWYPQIVFNHHQTGPSHTRIFIPPYADPVNPDIHPAVVSGVNMVGAAIASRYAVLGMPGYVSRAVYSMWWNGGMRLAPYFHNMVGILTETSHRSPSPYTYDTDNWPELIPMRRGEQPRTDGTSIFHPYPWKAAESHFRDAVEYMIEASLAALNLAANYRVEFPFNMWRMGQDAVEAGKAGGPYAYVVAPDQWDPGEAREMLNVLRRNGVEVHRATQSFSAGGKQYPTGSFVLYTAQAFRPCLMNLMEPQRYPERRKYPGGPPETPYDLAGWTIPIQMGVSVARIDRAFSAETEGIAGFVETSDGEVRGAAAGFGYALSPRQNAAVRTVNRLLAEGEVVHRAVSGFDAGSDRFDPGTFVIEKGGDTERRAEAVAKELGVDFVGLGGRPSVGLERLERPRVGVYASWVANDDQGWTLWLMENYDFEVDLLHNADIQSGDLSRYHAIIIPDQGPDDIMKGHPPGTMPYEFTGGIGAQGVSALDRFVRNGGTLIGFDDASDFAVEQLGLPVDNAVAGLAPEQFFIPGSLIRTDVDVEHPLAYGMQKQVSAFFSQSRAFDVVTRSDRTEGGRVELGPAPDIPVEVVARYAREDLLMSGWAQGEEKYLSGKPAVLRVEHGKGSAVLFGFRPQFRGQPRGTYKLIFNAILSASIAEPSS